MSWHGYVPGSIMDLYGCDPTMKEHVYHYGMAKKHNGDDSHIMNLFREIDQLQKENLVLKEKLSYQEKYFNNALKKVMDAGPEPTEEKK